MTKPRKPKRNLGMLKLGMAVSSVAATWLGTNWLAQQDAGVAVAETAVFTPQQPANTNLDLPPIPTIVAPALGAAPQEGQQRSREGAFTSQNPGVVPTIAAPQLQQLQVTTQDGSFTLDLQPIPAAQAPVFSQPITRSRSSR